MLGAVRKVTERIASLPLSGDELAAFKEELQNDFQTSMQNTEYVMEAVMVRYSEGKDLVSGFGDALKNVSIEKVRSVLEMLASGASVEYIII